MKKLYTTIVALLFLNLLAHSQYSELSLSIEHVELSENIQGEYIFLDKLGFLWIVSNKSSYRYDGMELTDLRQDQNFHHIISQSQKIIETTNYNKYFIIYGTGTTYLLPYGSNKLIKVKLPDQHIVLDAELNKDTDEVILLSYANDNLFISKINDDESEILSTNEVKLNNPAGKIAIGKENYFILTIDHILCINQKSYQKSIIDLPISLSTPTILSNEQSLFILEDRYLVFSHTYDSELFFTDLHKKNYPIVALESPNEVSTICGVWKDAADNIIAAWKNDKGFVTQIYLYNSILKAPINLPVFDPTLTSLSGNNFNDKIFSTGYYNVNIIFPKNNLFKRFQDTVLQDGNYLQDGKSIRGIGEYDGEIFLLRENDHFFSLNPDNGRETLRYVVNEYNDTIRINCTNSLISKAGFLWFSTCLSQNLNYLIRYNPKTHISKLIEIPFRIKSISAYNDTTLLMTSISSSGLSHIALYNVHSLELKEIIELRTPLQSRNNTYAYVVDNAVFLGTSSGIKIYNKEKWRENDAYSTLKDYLSNHHITHITDDDHYIFLSTIDFGLVIFNKKTGDINKIDRSKGLLTNAICAVLKDKSNRYWISTFNGLYVLDEVLTLVKAYFEKDGINHNEFNRFAYLSYNGKLYFGGINGYLQVDLEEIEALKVDSFNSYLSTLSIYDSRTDAEQISIINGNPKVIRLEPSQNNLRVNVASPMDRNRGNLIRVSIDNGQNTVWTYLNANSGFNLGNLQRGYYEMIIQEKGPGLSWDVAGTTRIPIIKSDYFYNSPYFKGLVISLILGTILYYFYRRRQQKIELLEMRQRIASDLHDEIGSVLTGIASKAEILSNKDSYKDSGDMDYFIKDSKKALEIMRDTIWSVNPAHDTMRSLTDRMKDFAFNMLSHKDIPIKYSIDIENESSRISPAFRKDVYMIYKETITNILKHSQPTEVFIKINSNTNQYNLMVKNDGISKIQGKGLQLGLKSIQNRAKDLGGHISIENGQYFVINLSCPL